MYLENNREIYYFFLLPTGIKISWEVCQYLVHKNEGGIYIKN